MGAVRFELVAADSEHDAVEDRSVVSGDLLIRVDDLRLSRHDLAAPVELEVIAGGLLPVSVKCLRDAGADRCVSAAGLYSAFSHRRRSFVRSMVVGALAIGAVLTAGYRRPRAGTQG